MMRLFRNIAMKKRRCFFLFSNCKSLFQQTVFSLIGFPSSKLFAFSSVVTPMASSASFVRKPW